MCIIVRGVGDLDLGGCRNDSGRIHNPVVLAQDVVDVVAEMESHCLFGSAVCGKVSLDCHGEGDGFHV